MKYLLQKRFRFLVLLIYFTCPIIAEGSVRCGDSAKYILNQLKIKANSTSICSSNKNILWVEYTDPEYVMYPGVKGSQCTLVFQGGFLTYTEGCNPGIIKKCGQVVYCF